MAVWEISRAGRNMALAWPNLVDWREGSHTLSSPAGYGTFPSTVLGLDEPRVR